MFASQTDARGLEISLGHSGFQANLGTLYEDRLGKRGWPGTPDARDLQMSLEEGYL